MKQAEDTTTIDMYNPELGDSLTTQDAAPSKYRFRFYVTTREGVTTEWTGLTAKRAKDMYAYTSQSQPSNVTAFGWEELK
jgi:hypothetical protein